MLPEAGFIAEEGTESATSSEYQWIIDPLDGTTNFIQGIPVFSVSPKASKYLKNVVAPSCCPIVINAGLQDCCIAPVSVSVPWPDVL